MASTCSVRRCTSPAFARGWCAMHYSRWRRHGDTSVVKVSAGTFAPGHPGANDHPADNLPPGGAAHPRWTGDACTYQAAHSRVRSAYGSPSDYVCPCGAAAQDWAYDHADLNELHDERGRPYSPDPEHYGALCRRCHRSRDRG